MFVLFFFLIARHAPDQRIMPTASAYEHKRKGADAATGRTEILFIIGLFKHRPYRACNMQCSIVAAVEIERQDTEKIFSLGGN